ncbi:MAG: hypothetical protein BalsKO_28470 [Balneolaceae bacterium]
MIEKRKRFEKIAGNRVQFILDKLDLLGNCSNRSNYEYSEEDVKKMFNTIKSRLSQVEVLYKEEIDKKNKKKFTF